MRQYHGHCHGTNEPGGEWGGFWLACAALLALSISVLSVLPANIALFGLYWVCLSITLGIGFGHAVLNED